MTTATHDPQTEADAWCTPKPKRATGGGLRSVGTALDVLECFAVDSALGVSDVARRLGMTTTTLYMYVNGDGTPKAPGQALLDGVPYRKERLRAA